jgi:hypothetical protein
MNEKRLTVGEIEVAVRGLFTTHHTFHSEAGILAEVKFPAFSQSGEYRASGGRKLLMQKTGWLSTSHELIEGNRVRGTADQPGILRQDFSIRFNGQPYRLDPKGILNRGWVLSDGQGRALLDVEPRGAFKQGAFLTILRAVDADLVAFAYYLVHTRWQEAAAAGAVTAGTAAS